MNKALLSSKNMCWCTPQDFFDKLNEEFSFTLDAAATDKTAKCPLYFTPEDREHGEAWKAAFDRIFEEYNRIAQDLFGEGGEEPC